MPCKDGQFSMSPACGIFLSRHVSTACHHCKQLISRCWIQGLQAVRRTVDCAYWLCILQHLIVGGLIYVAGTGFRHFSMAKRLEISNPVSVHAASMVSAALEIKNPKFLKFDHGGDAKIKKNSAARPARTGIHVDSMNYVRYMRPPTSNEVHRGSRPLCPAGPVMHHGRAQSHWRPLHDVEKHILKSFSSRVCRRDDVMDGQMACGLCVTLSGQPGPCWGSIRHESSSILFKIITYCCFE